MFTGSLVEIVDAETVHSAQDLPTGWTDKNALGLSIGVSYSYRDARMQLFDRHTLSTTVTRWVDEQPLLVSFNGISFDFPLFRAILRQESPANAALCEAFEVLCATSYDLLAEVWRASPGDKFSRGLNSLDALCLANGLGQKTGSGALAPHLWAQGRIADVVNYCMQDVSLTKALLELVTSQDGWLERATGPLRIRTIYEGSPDSGLPVPQKEPTDV